MGGLQNTVPVPYMPPRAPHGLNSHGGWIFQRNTVSQMMPQCIGKSHMFQLLKCSGMVGSHMLTCVLLCSLMINILISHV